MSTSIGPLSPAAFDGVRVVEFAQFVFVPACGALLSDWGADVIKIEHPVRGDSYRGLVSNGILPTSASGVNEHMELHNRGKRSMGLDVSTDEGRGLLLQLIESADVFLTNFLPSTLKKLQLDVDDLREINPKIIYARGHGFGVRGADADMPAFDATAYWARGGFAATLTPPELERPIGQRGALGDRSGAANLAFGVAGALFRRERTGQPSVIDVSLLSTAVWALASDVLTALQDNWGAVPVSGQSVTDAPNPLTNNYGTKDGQFLSLNVLQPDRHWPDMARAIGREDLLDDPRFADGPAVLENARSLIEILVGHFETRTLAEWRDLLYGKRVPWAPISRIPDLIDDPQVVANGYILEIEHDEETIRVPAGPVQFDEAPPTVGRAPEHAEHTEELLLEMGFRWEDLAEFKDRGTIT